MPRFYSKDIWKLGVSWDDKLPDDLEVKFKKWIDSTKHLNSLAISRCYFTNIGYPGRDGLIRSVDVKTRKGVINRSIQRLHDLEMNSHLNSVLENLSEQISNQVIDNPDANIDIATDELSEQNSNQVVIDDNVYSRRGRPIKKPRKLDL